MKADAIFVPPYAIAVLAAKAARRAQELHFDIGPNSSSDHLMSISAGYQQALVEAVAGNKKAAVRV